MSIMRLLSFSAFVGLGSAGCTTDEHCSLNGECVAGVCHCDEGWTTIEGSDSPECGNLDFLPSPTTACGPACAFHGGAGGIDTKTSSWGGSVNRADDGKYWMFAAEMAQHCSLKHWTTNSQVVAAVSNTPEGPYSRVNIAVPPWAHNPEVVRAPDGTWVMYTLGDGKGSHDWGPEVNCSKMAGDPGADADGGADAPAAAAAAGDAAADDAAADDAAAVAEVRARGHAPCVPGACNFTVHSASDPRGPWTAAVMVIQNWTNSSWNLNNWNPAPVMLPDGRVRVMAHTDWKSPSGDGTGGWNGEVILEAPSWKGPYTVVTGDELDKCDYCEEDPYMWVDRRGHWHALYHRMFDPYGPLDPHWGQEDGSWERPKDPVPFGWSGGHAFSRDGLTNWSKWSRCWNTSVLLAGGKRYELSRRERPKLLFGGADGKTPTHMFNGAIAAHPETGRDGGSITFTAVSPLNVKANRDRDRASPDYGA